MTWDPRNPQQRPQAPQQRPQATPATPAAPGGWGGNSPWLQGLAQRVQQARQGMQQPQSQVPWGNGAPPQMPQGGPPPGPAVGAQQVPPQAGGNPWGQQLMGNLGAALAQRQAAMAAQGGQPGAPMMARPNLPQGMPTGMPQDPTPMGAPRGAVPDEDQQRGRGY